VGQDDKRDEILDAATRCFARYGFDKATMDDIGKLVGMNKVSLYYYFDGKEALFKAALAREAGQYEDRCLAEAKTGRDFRERITLWTSRSFRYSQESDLLRTVSAEELSALKPTLREYRRLSFDSASAVLASFIEEGIAAGEARPCDARKTAETIIRVAFSLKHMAFQEKGDDVDIDALLGLILYAVGLILDGIDAKGGENR
jgi:AcrR family transcriptional regulator